MLAERPALRDFPEPRAERTSGGNPPRSRRARELSGARRRLDGGRRASAIHGRDLVRRPRVDGGPPRRARRRAPRVPPSPRDRGAFRRDRAAAGRLRPAPDRREARGRGRPRRTISSPRSQGKRRAAVIPRAFRGEQTYWTVAGVDADTEEVLVGEDGALEPGKGIVLARAVPLRGRPARDVERLPRSPTSLERGDLPIPTVTWKAGDLALDVTALMDGAPGASVLRARYRVRNAGAESARVRLFVAVRPFLVNPPTQFLNAPHGVSKIDALSFRGRTLAVNRTRAVSAIARSRRPSARRHSTRAT